MSEACSDSPSDDSGSESGRGVWIWIGTFWVSSASDMEEVKEEAVGERMTKSVILNSWRTWRAWQSSSGKSLSIQSVCWVILG